MLMKKTRRWLALLLAVILVGSKQIVQEVYEQTGGAVASSLEIAIALGPSKCSSNAAKSVPSKALFIIVFLQTL